MQHFLAFLFLPLLASAQGAGEPEVRRCEPLVIPLCQDVRYNHTIFPTLLGHSTQEEAARDLQQFQPFLTGGSDLKFLLCYLYAPVCTILESAIPPCRDVCERAKLSSEKQMLEAGVAWPESLRCEKFPVDGLCVRHADSAATTAAPAQAQTKPERRGPKRPEEVEDSGRLMKTDN